MKDKQQTEVNVFRTKIMKYGVFAEAVIASLLVQTFPIYGQDLVWAKQIGGTSFDIPFAAAVDSTDNVYVGGRFSDTGDFDPGPAVFNLAAVSSIDAYLLKLDSNGTFVWAVHFGGISNEAVSGLAVDANDNVLAIGSFQAAIDFDPGPGNVTLTPIGANDGFVCKLTSGGDLLWARHIGGLLNVTPRGVALDANDNVLIAGDFLGTPDFDPGPGVVSLTSAGGIDMFVAKLDSNGNFVWARRMGGPTTQESVFAIAVDSSGNVYTTGHFDDTGDYDPGAGTFNLTPFGEHDVFVSKLDSNGNFVWAKQLGGSGSDSGNDIAVDGSGNVYAAGRFRYLADFDPGPGTFTLNGINGFDGFLAKLDTNGEFVWAKQVDGTGFDSSRHVALDNFGNVYSAGEFTVTTDFDPGPGTFTLTGLGDRDVFVLKLDSSGNFVSARQLGGAGLDEPGDLAVDSAGNVLTVGSFTDTADFDPGPGTFNFTSAGLADIFVSKIGFQTPQQALQALMDQTAALNLQQGIDSSLDAKLEAAANALDDVNEGNNAAAVNVLYAFINAVDAQRGKKITNDQADALNAAAEAIIAQLTGA